MTHDDVTAGQAAEIGGRLEPTLAYLGRLNERMQRRGFDKGDPLRVNVMFALEAVRQLRAALHKIEARPGASMSAEQIIPGEPVPQWRRAMGPD